MARVADPALAAALDEIVARFKAICTARGVSPATAAVCVGYRPVHLRRWLDREHDTISVRMILRFARYFNIPPGQLLPENPPAQLAPSPVEINLQAQPAEEQAPARRKPTTRKSASKAKRKAKPTTKRPTKR